MPKPPRKDDHEHEHKREHGREHDRKHGHEHEHEREEGGDDPRRHASIIARRWEGSPPPNAERYAKALQQWRTLPGAVSSPATDPPAPKKKPGHQGHSREKDNDK
jgi:hypothetical protein